jgi:hypothetical protein
VSLVMVSVSVSVKLRVTQAERRRTAPARRARWPDLRDQFGGRPRDPIRRQQAPQMKGPRHRRLSCRYDHARPPAPASDTMRQGATDRFTDIFTDITTDRP